MHYTTIDGVVYDITDFLSNHPGGSDLLMLASGRDATILFHSYHRRFAVAAAALSHLPRMPPASATRLKGAHVARDPNSRTDPVIESPLLESLRKRVNSLFPAGTSSRGGSFMLIKTAVLIALTAAVWYIAVVRGAFIWAPLLGVLLAINGLAIQHDCNHGALSESPLLNRALGWIDDLIGGSALIWRHQHVVAHHAHPNDIDLDPDSYANYPLVRFNSGLKRRWWHALQFVYAPLLLYPLIGLSYAVGDVTALVRAAYAHVPLHGLRPVDWVLFVAGAWIGLCFSCRLRGARFLGGGG
jgi:acyl-lipid (7-3)-desaturase (Delta-4 desaturase)